MIWSSSLVYFLSGGCERIRVFVFCAAGTVYVCVCVLCIISHIARCPKMPGSEDGCLCSPLCNSLSLYKGPVRNILKASAGVKWNRKIHVCVFSEIKLLKINNLCFHLLIMSTYIKSRGGHIVSP